jgi:hypothetical protein
MRKVASIFIIFFCFLVVPKVYADDYTLPYPGIMPGSKLYTIHRLLEKGEKYYYFGDFGQFMYNLHESDTYLVQAKTLFEYKQYLLGYQALKESNNYYNGIYPSLLSAQIHKKNISEKEKLFISAKQAHLQLLLKMKNEVPNEITWQDEKKPAVSLSLQQLIEHSIKLRQQ